MNRCIKLKRLRHSLDASRASLMGKHPRFMKFCYLLLLFMMVLACLPVAAIAQEDVTTRSTFTDISGHWAKADIEQAVAKGYVNGFPNGKFKPDDPVTRAQLIKMIVTALGIEHGPETSLWYTTYVRAAKASGIYQGDADFPEWNMNKEISREHMAWLSVRAADPALVTVESSGITRNDETRFYAAYTINNKITRTDEEMRRYYEGFLVHAAFKRGILQGFGGNDIRLAGTTTRAQAVTVIERILTLQGGGKLPSDKYATGEAELLWLKTNVFTVAPHIFDDPAGSSMKRNYRLENLVFKNKTFHTEVKRILLIDLDDPKDPYRHLLPATEKLGFRDFRNIGKLPKDAYALYIDYETYYNHNPKMYTGTIDVQASGYIRPDPYPYDRLTNPSRIITEEEGYSILGGISDRNTRTGTGTVVWAIPNSGYELEKQMNERGIKIDTPDRSILLRFYTSFYYGDQISSHVFAGRTTHHGK